MTLVDNPERKRILKQVLDARSLPEIDAATETLRVWVRRNPEDAGIVEAFEGLSLMRDIAEEQAAEEIHNVQKAALVAQRHELSQSPALKLL
jgi:hypothetical protein